ncbi:hypothetical protein A2863_02075 [Candidatus Woesebacteria bacterium RIFCSPHIGHO2_01_FULL_38_9b]|uniref:SHS2 domain-containing protein n=1 Tax=Candidatus Woesebacteria bacterium RIFCSPHIGHO2_01_FULL_38_9b TaxID=1802493 RepID=A0A1F7Y646_9BACT|nr:MAG: hypothetical protein A2863_02075 [Candidatus Woesebacteria bacterium RIFCSPHIGHO2_01_FULL_38_9b]
MFKKSFVSLYFLADRLLVAELSSNKRKLRAFASIELPKGLIENYRVSDVSKLTQLLQELWIRLRLREKTVGIILPEFSTFTKFFKIPKLSLSELNEAVVWQAQEYLPSALKDMEMDWKIVNKDLSGYEVLIVAVEKQILSDFVEAAENAGLFPLSVETPSICLVRLTKDIQEGALIVYQNLTETVLVISQKEKIIGSSVVRGNDGKEIIRTAVRMVAHYKNIKTENILVGGLMDSSLPQKLSEQFKLKVTPIKPGIMGDEKIIQEYAIPLSQQLQEPAEPSDPASLNLLPGGLVERYKHENLRLQVWGLTLTVTLFVWTSFLITLGAYLWMMQQLNEMKIQNQSSPIALERQKATADVKDINSISERVLSVKKISVLPQKIFNDVYKVKPSKVKIVSWGLDLDKGEISISGEAQDRESLIEFKQKLEGNSDITAISIPISSFEKDTNLDFQVRFSYVPIAVTNKEAKPKPIQEVVK